MKKLVRVVVACLAIVFAIALTESADAQPQQRTPQQYRKGECIYQQGTNQLVGCYSTGSGRSWYYHVPWQAMQDQKTGFWVADRGGVLYILTQQGWHPMATHPQGKQLLAEMQAANQQQGQGQQGGERSLTCRACLASKAGIRTYRVIKAFLAYHLVAEARS